VPIGLTFSFVAAGCTSVATGCASVATEVIQ
jgi:hypothetical protein